MWSRRCSFPPQRRGAAMTVVFLLRFWCETCSFLDKRLGGSLE